MNIRREKISNSVKLKDLDACDCFLNQYDAILIRLAETDIRENVNKISCVYLTDGPEWNKGMITFYNSEDLVKPVECELIVRE